MTLLWLLFLPVVFSQKLSPQENYRLKQECGDQWLHMPQRPRRSAEKFIAIGSGVPPGELPFVAGLATRSEAVEIRYSEFDLKKAYLQSAVHHLSAVQLRKLQIEY
ncbi:hypothetical protein Aduo_019860 [Ancylostoma duodenale]